MGLAPNPHARGNLTAGDLFWRSPFGHPEVFLRFPYGLSPLHSFSFVSSYSIIIIIPPSLLPALSTSFLFLKNSSVSSQLSLPVGPSRGHSTPVSAWLACPQFIIGTAYATSSDPPSTFTPIAAESDSLSLTQLPYLLPCKWQ